MSSKKQNTNGRVDLLAQPEPKGKLHPDAHKWIENVPVKTSQDIETPKRLIDQIIGQDKAVSVALKAAEQKRNLMLIGDPGTGKSMLAKAMAEVLPTEKQDDIIAYHNPDNPNNPKVMQLKGGQGRQIVEKYEAKAQKINRIWTIAEWSIALLAIWGGVYISFINPLLLPGSGIMSFLFIMLLVMAFLYISRQAKPKSELMVPKLLVENGEEAKPAPYVDATGSQAGALLGDVRHDPFQSGGLETPPHQRIDAGAIHRAHRGVLFIDEINVLRLASQQALLTAMQDGEYAISGQSQTSSGANVRTESVPCDFILVAAGNQDALEEPDGFDKGMHPALRSRIRGYGYEVYVNSIMDDTHENRLKLLQFVQQEVERDGRIPPLDKSALAEVIREGQRRSGRTGKLTLRLRELGGLVRTAGDFANTEGKKLITVEHVRMAKEAARSMEQQMTETEIQNHMADHSFHITGDLVGTANGVGVIGTGEVGEPAGIVIPIEAAVVPALSRHGGAIVLGGGLQQHRGHGVDNVGAVLKNLKGADIADHDLHIDGHVGHPDTEVEGIGIAAAVAAISALESAPIRQDTVTIGNIAVSGEIRPVRATLQRVEAAAAVGYRRAVVPASLKGTLVMDKATENLIDVVYCTTLTDVLDATLELPAAKKRSLRTKLTRGTRPSAKKTAKKTA